jgi:hypothetical protein
MDLRTRQAATASAAFRRASSSTRAAGSPAPGPAERRETSSDAPRVRDDTDRAADRRAARAAYLVPPAAALLALALLLTGLRRAREQSAGSAGEPRSLNPADHRRLEEELRRFSDP